MGVGKQPNRPFPGTEPEEVRTDLPSDPLPPDPEDSGLVRMPADAPVMLIPVAAMDEGVLAKVGPQLEEIFRRPTSIHKPLPVPKYAYNPTREQYHAASILKRVEAMRDPSWDCAVSITDFDLFVPETPFVFGEADRSTRSALVSISRLGSEVGSPESRNEAMMRRLLTELIHNIGLIRGLATCPNNRCVMFFAATTQEIDKKGMTFCANCRKRLAALDSATSVRR